jgi:hypothetical protein
MLETKVYPQENFNIVEKINFDGAKSRTGVSERVLFVSPKGDTLCHAFHLEFEAKTNVDEYEEILLGLNMAKPYGN